MSHEIVIRQLLADDAGAYRTLRLAGLEEAPDSFGSDYATEAAAAREKFVATLIGGYVAGAFLQGRLVAVAGFRSEEREKIRHRGGIWGVYVATDARGNGLGRQIMEFVLAHARTKVSQVHLAVTASNATAVTLYEHLGFVRYGTEPRALFVGGRYLDEDLMVLQFS